MKSTGGRDPRWAKLAELQLGDAEYNARRAKVCTGKFAYEDPHWAVDEMPKLVEKRDDLTDYDLSLYRCEFCDHWHLGTIRRMWKYIQPESENGNG